MPNQTVQQSFMNKLKQAGLFDQNEVQDIANQTAQQAVEAAAPTIGQQAVQNALSPDNVEKKTKQYKQGILQAISLQGKGQ